MKSINDLVAHLEAAGFRVAPPGDTSTSLPCVGVEPVRLRLQPGGRHLYHVVDVVPAVVFHATTTNYQPLEDMTAEVMRTLSGTEYAAALDEIPLEYDLDRSPPVQMYRINVQFHGIDLCPDPEPTP